MGCKHGGRVVLSFGAKTFTIPLLLAAKKIYLVPHLTLILLLGTGYLFLNRRQISHSPSAPVGMIMKRKEI